MMRGCVYSPRLSLMRELSAKLTEGETPDGQINIFIYTASLSFRSLRQKSKIFDTSLVRGRHWCDGKSHTMHYTERCIEVRSYLFDKSEFVSLF